VGFCYFGPTRDAEDHAGRPAEIYALNVAPQHWRHGAGRALCEHAARDAQARECDAMILWVLEGNRAARRFYQALGYAADGAERVNVKLMPVTPLGEVRYRKAIA